MTKYNDKMSPLVYVAVMRGELLPKAVLRVLYAAKDGKFDIIEYILEQVQYVNTSPPVPHARNSRVSPPHSSLSFLSLQVHFSLYWWFWW
jgi:type VI protein secretion system component Hcp